MFVDYEGDKSRPDSQAGIGETFSEVLRRRLSRRGLVMSASAAGIAAAAFQITGPRLIPMPAEAAAVGRVGALGFAPITLDTGPDPIVAAGSQKFHFLSWGIRSGPTLLPSIQRTGPWRPKRLSLGTTVTGSVSFPCRGRGGGSDASELGKVPRQGRLFGRYCLDNERRMFAGLTVAAAGPAFCADRNPLNRGIRDHVFSTNSAA